MLPHVRIVLVLYEGYRSNTPRGRTFRLLGPTKLFSISHIMSASLKDIFHFPFVVQPTWIRELKAFHVEVN
jgi:hypothetical protein